MEHILKLRQWGNSVGFTIPKTIRDAMGLSVDQRIKYQFDGHRLIIEADNVPNLDELIKQMRVDNAYGEISGGSSVGNEF